MVSALTNRYDTVMVYNYRIFDLASLEMHVADGKATREHITGLHHAELLPATGERVPLSALDAEGRFRRIATGWGALDGEPADAMPRRFVPQTNRAV